MNTVGLDRLAGWRTRTTLRHGRRGHAHRWGDAALLARQAHDRHGRAGAWSTAGGRRAACGGAGRRKNGSRFRSGRVACRHRCRRCIWLGRQFLVGGRRLFLPVRQSRGVEGAVGGQAVGWETRHARSVKGALRRGRGCRLPHADRARGRLAAEADAAPATASSTRPPDHGGIRYITLGHAGDNARNGSRFHERRRQASGHVPPACVAAAQGGRPRHVGTRGGLGARRPARRRQRADAGRGEAGIVLYRAIPAARGRGRCRRGRAPAVLAGARRCMAGSRVRRGCQARRRERMR